MTLGGFPISLAFFLTDGVVCGKEACGAVEGSALCRSGGVWPLLCAAGHTGVSAVSECQIRLNSHAFNAFYKQSDSFEFPGCINVLFMNKTCVSSYNALFSCGILT